MRLPEFIVFTLLAVGPGAVSVAAAAAAPADASAGGMLALAEKPVRILRGVQLFVGVNGTLVLKDDMIETGAGGAQIELGGGNIVALGPQTRLYLASLGQDGKGPAELALLQGWVKARAGSGTGVQLAGNALQAIVSQGAVIVHGDAGREELFADEGEQQATRLDEKGKPGPPVKVPSESYAYVDAGKPLAVLPRPAKTFLAAMPPSFRDRLAPGPALGKAARQPAALERDAAFADVEDWLRSSLAVRKTFVARFRPRLKDPEFRKALDQALGKGSEWQAVLHPPPPPVSRPRSATQF